TTFPTRRPSDLDDGHNDRGRHAVALRGLVQQGLVFLPELHAPVDALGLDKTRAVSQPATPHFAPRRRRGDQPRNGSVIAGVGQGGADDIRRQAALCRNLVSVGARGGSQFARGQGGRRGLRLRFGRANADGGGVRGGGAWSRGVRGAGRGRAGAAGQDQGKRADLQESPTDEHNLPYGDYLSYPPVVQAA